MEDFARIASAIHDAWRHAALRSDGVFDHGLGRTEGLAHLEFAELPAEWRAENLAAAEAAVQAVITSVTVEEAAAKVHESWLSRNDSWAPEELKCSYDRLSAPEKEKDRVVARIAAKLTGRPLADLASVRREIVA